MARSKKKLPGKEEKTPYRLPTLYPGQPIETMQSPATDPFGSYTGNAVNNEVPVQDADDL